MTDIISNQVIMNLTKKITQMLNDNQQELAQITWQNGEANIDTDFSLYACDCCEYIWNNEFKSNIDYENISIKCNKPDITITFIQDNNIILNKKIELKSGIHKIIPGSTIGKLDMSIPVIFCLRNQNNDTFICKYAQYFQIIGETDIDRFQDRTPRPYINFDKMFESNIDIIYQQKDKNDWIEHYVNCALNRLNNNIFTSWQDNLIDKLNKKIIEDFIRNTTLNEFQNLQHNLNYY